MTPIHVHVFLQMIDGIMTYAGVTLLGIGPEIEGNPLVRWLMYALGPGTALVLVKGAAITAVLYAASKSQHSVMLEKILSRVNLLYMLSAAMWAYVFLN